MFASVCGWWGMGTNHCIQLPHTLAYHILTNFPNFCQWILFRIHFLCWKITGIDHTFTKCYLHINRRGCKVIPHAKIQHLTYANKIYFILKTKSVINWPDDGMKAKSGQKRDAILVWYYKVVTTCCEPRTFKYKAENILCMCIDRSWQESGNSL